MKLIGGLVAGILIGIVLMAVVGMGFLIPPEADPLDSYCQGAVDVWLLGQGADPFDPKVAELIPQFDAECREDVLSGTFAGRASQP